MLCALALRYMDPLCQISMPKAGSHREEAEYASREGLGPIRSGSLLASLPRFLGPRRGLTT
jgi:hypothetical protein